MATSSSDASTILTVDELSHDDVTSSAAVIDDSTESTSKDEDRCRDYDSDSWETASSSPRRPKASSERTETSRTPESITDDDDAERRQGSRQRDRRRRPLSDSEDSDVGQYVRSKESSLQHQFIQTKLKLLKKPFHKLETNSRQEIMTCDPEANEKSMFCQSAIRVLEKRKAVHYDVSRTMPWVNDEDKAPRTATGSYSKSHHMLDNREVIDRLKIENLLSKMQMAASIDVEDKHHSCPHCHKLQEASLKRDFIQHRTSQLKNELTERKVDWLLNTRDGVTAVGDLARWLPKPSDDPEEIWNQLMSQGIT